MLAGEYKPDSGRVEIQGYQWKAKVMNPNRFGDEKRVKVEVGESWRKTMTEGRARLLEDNKKKRTTAELIKPDDTVETIVVEQTD